MVDEYKAAIYYLDDKPPEVGVRSTTNIRVKSKKLVLVVGEYAKTVNLHDQKNK
jgi:hypothetical protein